MKLGGFNMKRFIPFILLFLIVGCKEEAQDPTPTQSEVESPTQNEENNSSEKDDTSTESQDPDKQYPSLNENITTFKLMDGTSREATSLMLSNEKSHEFNVHFDIPMKMDSVEQSILSSLSFTPTFEWQDSQNLSLIIPAKSIKENKGRVTINIDGAITETGKKLEGHNQFKMVLKKPTQFYAYSMNESAGQKLSSFKSNFFRAEPLADGMYVLYKRTEFCECDAVIPNLTYLYKPGNEPIFYPEGIELNPMSEEPLIVDSRGFFLSENSPHFDEETQHRVNPDGFVGGARIIPDQEKLLMAVGDSKEDERFDLVVHDLTTSKQERYQDVIPGMPESALTGGKIPVIFYSYGEHIGFVADSDPFNKSYYYNKQTGETKVLSDNHTYFSADGKYHYVAGEGIYQNDQLIKPIKQRGVHWAPTGNTYAYRDDKGNTNMKTYTLTSMDQPDQKTKITLTQGEYIHKFGPNGNRLIIRKKR